MARAREVIPKIAVVLGIGVLCLPIFLLLMPYVEQSRTEARMMMTYIEVCGLAESLETQAAGAPLPRLDLWYQPYQIQPLPDGGVRVLSTGPNRSTSPGSLDEDDIYSDMPESPSKPIQRQKQRQWLLALGTMVAAWIALSALYLRSRA
jgi:hypothetical protein